MHESLTQLSFRQLLQQDELCCFNKIDILIITYMHSDGDGCYIK